MKTIKTKRIYTSYFKSDGYRILIDRRWPRGLTKAAAHVDLWLKDIAPSTELRQWFKHDPKKWPEFKKRYFKELTKKKDLINILLEKAARQQVTLLFGAKDEMHNNAIALHEYLRRKNCT
jgi:uncharacterized protein YeaO (DUF488 family)